jgi:thioredoxin reductase (NADPH)
MREAGIAIVGAGPAGVAAAIQCVRLGVPPLLLDATGQAGGLVECAFRIENHPDLERPLSGLEYAARLRASLARFSLTVERCIVHAITTPADGHLLSGRDLEPTLARAVILAVGTIPRGAGIPGEEELAGRGVFRDLRDVLAARPGRVAVVGGGEAAFDCSLSLAAAGARVELCWRGEHPRARGWLAGEVAAHPGISGHPRFQALSLEPAGCGVALTGETPAGACVLKLDAVLIAVGRDVSGLVPAAMGGTVLTSEAGLFICGDARLGRLGQAAAAVGDGLAAGSRAVAFLDGVGGRV